ncbi:MAG: hypothetical protein ABSB11_01005 [Sedimentisphaerales bacterium]
MKRPSLPLQFQFFLIIAAFFSCNQVLFANEPNEPVFVWGPEVNGLQAAVEFVPEKEVYTQGEIIDIVFYIRNVSTHRIQFVTSDWRNGESCIIKDANGTEIKRTTIHYSGWPRIVCIVLDPCESEFINSSSLGIAKDNHQKFGYPIGSYAYLEPGRYSLCYHLRFPDITMTSFPLEPNDWIGTLKTGKRVLLVTVERREPNSPAKQ